MEALDLIDCLHRFRNNSVIFMGVRSDSTKICPLAGQSTPLPKKRSGGEARPTRPTDKRPKTPPSKRHRCARHIHTVLPQQPMRVGRKSVGCGVQSQTKPGHCTWRTSKSQLQHQPQYFPRIVFQPCYSLPKGGASTLVAAPWAKSRWFESPTQITRTFGMSGRR